MADFIWDGRDESGRLVPAGKYRYTFLGRFAADRLRPARPMREYEDLQGVAGMSEAYASTDEVIVDYSLSAGDSASLRESAALGSCQAQQNTPIESGFAYNFYYGSTHSHSNWSNGGARRAPTATSTSSPPSASAISPCTSAWWRTRPGLGGHPPPKAASPVKLLPSPAA